MSTQLAPIVLASSDDREAWLEARRQGVTATDVAKIGSGSATAMRRALQDKRGELRDFRTSAMQHGTRREPFIASWVEKRSRAAGFGSGPLVPTHNLYAWAEDQRHLATPDGISEDFDYYRESVEIKTTNKAWKSIPIGYLRQVWWQQHVLGAERTLVVWEQHADGVPVEMEPKWQWVLRDQAEIDALRVKADQLLEFMAREFPTPPRDIDEMIARFISAREKRDSYQKQMDDIEDALRARAGADGLTVLGTVGDLTISAPSTSTRFDSKAFQAADPARYAQFAKPSPVKGRFSITPLKTDEPAEESAA